MEKHLQRTYPFFSTSKPCIDGEANIYCFGKFISRLTKTHTQTRYKLLMRWKASVVNWSWQLSWLGSLRFSRFNKDQTRFLLQCCDSFIPRVLLLFHFYLLEIWNTLKTESFRSSRSKHNICIDYIYKKKKKHNMHCNFTRDEKYDLEVKKCEKIPYHMFKYISGDYYKMIEFLLCP